jgi:branched-chain amino acid transport system permease protein
MDLATLLILTQDGIGTGAVYALLAVALVLAFAVTRIIFIPQGDLVAYGALTMASIQAGHPPVALGLLVALAAVAFAVDGFGPLPEGRSRSASVLSASRYLAVPAALTAVVFQIPIKAAGLLFQAGLTVLLIAALGPLLYRVVYQPVAQRSVLLLLIISVALHFVLLGLGLTMFGPEGMRSMPLVDGRLDFGFGAISGQSIAVICTSLLLMLGLWLFFRYSLEGKAMLAAAVNPVGARLMGINVARTGRTTILLASATAAVSGILVGPTTTIYYDSGFLIGLKGFVAAIVGGLHSYPIAAVGALAVGQLEVHASYAASAYTEVLVFTLVIPILLWRSFATSRSGADL